VDCSEFGLLAQIARSGAVPKSSENISTASRDRLLKRLLSKGYVVREGARLEVTGKGKAALTKLGTGL
jgi:hypothetical protein